MSRETLSQAEADLLLAHEKEAVEEEAYEYPDLGGAIRVPLQSLDGREQFSLDVSRSEINLSKGTCQNRGRVTVVLARLDFGGPPHRNPDDEEIPCPHLHVYKEGFGDKWAFKVPVGVFSDLTDPWKSLHDFMRFCNVTKAPTFRRGLFT